MKIGIISDTHDNLVKIREAVKIFNEHEVDFVFHAGDFIAPFSLDPFQELRCDWAGVFGNNDGEKEGLSKRSGGRIKPPPLLWEVQEKRIAVTHQFSPVDAQIIISGHTHHPQIEKVGDKLLINPGEACGWLTEKSSLVILDLQSLYPKLVYF